MPPRIRLVFATLSLVLFLVAAVPLYGELSRRSDIWWTPHAMLVPLAESTDRVELYARGKPLAALLQAGQLRIEEEGGSSTWQRAMSASVSTTGTESESSASRNKDLTPYPVLWRFSLS